MRKYLKFVAAILAIVGVVMMFFNQVTITWASNNKEVLNFNALIGGTYSIGTSYNGVTSGLVGYILLGVGAIIILLAAIIPYFKEHDILSAVVTGLGVVAIIVGVFLVFFLRNNFASDNGLVLEKVKFGFAPIVAGSCGGLAALLGGLGVVLDIAEN